MAKIPGDKKLRPICRANGLPQKGTKSELLGRLMAHGLSLSEILAQVSTVVQPTNSQIDATEELHSLRSQNLLYATLPDSIHDIPGEKSLRPLCKQFGIKQFGSKLDLVARLLDSGRLSFRDIIIMSGYEPSTFALPLSPPPSSDESLDSLDLPTTSSEPSNDSIDVCFPFDASSPSDGSLFMSAPTIPPFEPSIDTIDLCDVDKIFVKRYADIIIYI